MQNMSTTTKTPERPLPPPGPQEARDLLGAVVAARDAGRAAARSVEAKIDRLDPRFATEAMLDEVRAIRAAAATAQEARLALLRPRVQRILACTAEAYRRETLRRASFASDPVADATLRSDARQTGLLAAGPDLVSAARDAAASGAVALAHTLRTVAEHRHDLGTLSDAQHREVCAAIDSLLVPGVEGLGAVLFEIDATMREAEAELRAMQTGTAVPPVDTVAVGLLRHRAEAERQRASGRK